MDPNPPTGRAPGQSVWDYNARVGLVLFAVYLALYAGFIALSAFGRDLMAKPAVGGVNLAVVYGFGLILSAFVLALVYMVLCKPEPPVGPGMTDEQVTRKFEQEEGQA